ncbi:hypothetical protein [Rhodococcus sp. IEGM 1408]|uniref:hypothetical protein n=1 Tax=Rhodococcus sp. IEGM 1408 TaxID=3082220 RepID=UPI0029545217|nr:hypothetical protein [Rhodococcus sp. IEGM 1408]MDV8001774.1 hypothetical protein [Rhodococcus sp. IEGM 1408]
MVVTEIVSTVSGPAPEQGGVALPDAGSIVVPQPPPVTPPVAPGSGGAGADLEAVVGSVSGTAGIAVAPVGGAGEVRSAGTWQTGVAWSTIKVPLAVAVARIDPQALEGATAAITVSDNRSAEILWNALGGGDAAAAAVGAVLTEGGDATSQVPSVRTRDGFSVFGQTRWALIDQARFGSRLPCLGSSARVVDLMGQVSSDQRWGLGRIAGARFKGGWGPGESGGYLVRQFGLVPGAGGDVTVAIAIEAPTFEAGTAALSTMADALAPRLASIPGGNC